MNRLKFRVWSKRTECWVTQCKLDMDKGKIPGLTSKDIVIEQCIGRKDKNGKFIYVGDILKSDYDYVGVVEIDKSGVWCLHGKKWVTFFEFVNTKDYEIIGNIHEGEKCK